jgi:hypothetical protein
MWRRMSVIACVAGIVAISLSAVTVQATVISVANPSFESPDVSGSPYAATFPVLSSGTRSFDAWGTESAHDGVVLNGHYDRAYTNLSGAQCGWMDVSGGGQTFVAYQDLTTATFEVNHAYTMKVGVGRLPTVQNENSVLNIALFARASVGDANHIAGSVNVRYGDLSATAMTDYTIEVPAVQSTDAWASLPISIWILNTGNGSTVGGSCWNFDDVRLTSTYIPEPSCMVVLGTAVFGLLAYAWRTRR